MIEFKESRGTRGGRRIGAGRKPGAVTVRTRDVANKIAGEGPTPLMQMYENMRFWRARADEILDEHDALEFADPDAGLTRRKSELMEASLQARICAQQCAVQLAPFVHPRLAAVVNDRPRPIISISCSRRSTTSCDAKI